MWTPVFKTGGFNRSPTPPIIISITYGGLPVSVYQFVYQFATFRRHLQRRQPADRHISDASSRWSDRTPSSLRPQGRSAVVQCEDLAMQVRDYRAAFLLCLDHLVNITLGDDLLRLTDAMIDERQGIITPEGGRKKTNVKQVSP